MQAHELKNAFLQEWPLERIRVMTLEEYTNLDKTSFCYWLEAKTYDLGSIWGGSSYKFGIYKRRNTSTTLTVDNRITDGEYAWFRKYGSTRTEAFDYVKSILIQIIEASQTNSLESIDTIDLGDAYKWKIAFLYGDFNIVNIFNHAALVEAATAKGYTERLTPYSALNRYLISQKPSSEDYFAYTGALWKTTSLAQPNKYWLYAPGENARLWDEFYQENIIGLGWDDLGDLNQYPDKNAIKKKLQELEGVTHSKKNDTAANYEFHKVMKPGDIIIVKKGVSELLGYGIVASDYYYDEDRETYQKCRKVDWKAKGNWPMEQFTLPVKTLSDITKYASSVPGFSKYYHYLMALMEGELNAPKNSIPLMNSQPLNQILYGPPGTGKTHELQQLIERWGLVTKPKNHDLTSFVEPITWWKVIGLALLELESATVPELAKHPLIISKLGSSNASHLKTRLWSSLQHHCVDHCEHVRLEQRTGVRLFYKEADSKWRLDNANEFRETYPTLLEEYGEYTSSALGQHKEKNYYFTTCHQSLSYEDFIEGIKPVILGTSDEKQEEEEKGDVRYTYRKGIFYKACDKAARLAGFINLQDALQSSKETRKKQFEEACETGNYFVLFLDEINRCNVSNVFGELITLIESDKRLGSAFEIADVKLPYSQDFFGVPLNLIIVGTMNTADRSVEALDTALRRRFSFTEMPPKPALLSPSALYCRLLWKYEKLEWEDPKYVILENNLLELLGCSDDLIAKRKGIWEDSMKGKDQTITNHFEGFSFSGLNLQLLLQTLNNRLEILLSRDHQIGHSYFMNITSWEDLRMTFKKNIIPLLQEYFYNDLEKIGWVLGEGFFIASTIKKDTVFSTFFNQPKPQIDVSYQLADIDTLDIKAAVNKLIGVKKTITQTEASDN